jgi:hypothetical protein
MSIRSFVVALAAIVTFASAVLPTAGAYAQATTGSTGRAAHSSHGGK